MTGRRLYVFGLAALTGCGGGVQTPKNGGGVSLEGTVTATEITSDGRELEIDPNGVTEVDVDSTIRLRMHSDKITVAAGSALAVDAGKVTAATARIKALTGLVEEQQAVLDTLAAKLSPTTPYAEFKKSVSELGTKEGTVLTKIRDYCKAYPEAACKDAYAKGQASVMPFLHAEIDRVKRDTAALLTKLGMARWRVEATLGSGARSEPLHVPNYDTRAEGPIRPFDRMSPKLSPEVLAQYEEAKRLADATNKMLQGNGDVVARVRELVEAELKEVKDLVAAVAAVPKLRDRLVALEKKLAKSPKGLAVLADVRGIADKVVAVKDACEDVVHVVETTPGVPELAARLPPAIRACEAKLEATPSLRADLRTLGKDAQAFIDAAYEQVAKEVGDEERQLLGAAARIAGVLERVDELFERAKRGLRDADATWSKTDFADRPITAVTDTSIELMRSGRQEGDTLFVRPSLIVDGGTSIEGPTTKMRVTRLGSHIDVSAALLFVTPHARAERADGSMEPRFVAAPALTIGYHYRFWRDSGEAKAGGLHGFFNFLNPGIGLHAATLAMPKREGGKAVDTTTIQLGLGPIVQLFGDVVQVGWGYDIQAERSYWFFGFGLKTATDLGLSFPSRGK
ncbi:MAG: hypothetical protein HYV09_19265 [Deltaproteobacteria bacterium]|nr:hypothetical protein [Deltaproteobacteria bacterium]